MSKWLYVYVILVAVLLGILGFRVIDMRCQYALYPFVGLVILMSVRLVFGVSKLVKGE